MTKGEAERLLTQTVHLVLKARGIQCCDGMEGSCNCSRDIIHALFQ